MQKRRLSITKAKFFEKGFSKVNPAECDNQAVDVITYMLFCPNSAGLRGPVDFRHVEMRVNSSLTKSLEARKSQPVLLNRG